ncbi:hypothetical protein GCM10009129_14050 [Psychrobacter aestuarii]|uniref:RES domain-containing protein n=2 Tax=Psychrobacter aestuarii TaxID=556327 RepID=A0ABP3FJK9_9GAMM
MHPNFDPAQTPINPARPLNDIPEPARRMNQQLRRLYGQRCSLHTPNDAQLSKWQLMASQPFAEHLAFLQAGGLIDLPESFYHNHSSYPLLPLLTDMPLLDMADIQKALRVYPQLTRYGMSATDKKSDTTSAKNAASLRALVRRYDPDELMRSDYADDWQVILQPQDFETGAGSLATDIMACSVAIHVIKSCPKRQSINHSYSADDICQYVRSYLLSQTILTPAQRDAYRQMPIFTGHIIVAAHHLGFDIQVQRDGTCYFNLSSRCSLLARYANIQDYHINGWSS